MRELADNIALLHKLTAEMNEVCRKLSVAGVTVGIRTQPGRLDPLDHAAVIRLEMALEPKPKET